MRSLIRTSARPWLSEGHRLADSPVACALVHERSHRDILNRDPVGLEQRDIVVVRPPTDFARDDFPDVVDAVPCEQPAFHRLDEVAALLFCLLDRVGRDESASTDRSVIELPSLEAGRPRSRGWSFPGQANSVGGWVGGGPWPRWQRRPAETPLRPI